MSAEECCLHIYVRVVYSFHDLTAASDSRLPESVGENSSRETAAH